MHPGDFPSFIYLGRCDRLLSFISPLPLVLNTGPSVPVSLTVYPPAPSQPLLCVGQLASKAVAGKGDAVLGPKVQGLGPAAPGRHRGRGQVTSSAVFQACAAAALRCLRHGHLARGLRQARMGRQHPCKDRRGPPAQGARSRKGAWERKCAGGSGASPPAGRPRAWRWDSGARRTHPPRSATEAVGGPGSDCGCPPRWEWPGRDRAPQGQASCWPPPSLPVFSPVSSHKTGRAGVSCRPPSCARGAPMLPVLVSRCSQEHVARHGEKRTVLEPDKSGDKPPCACKGEKALFFPVRPSQHGKASRPPPLPLPQIPLPHDLLPPHPRKSGSKPRPSLGHA